MSRLTTAPACTVTGIPTVETVDLRPRLANAVPCYCALDASNPRGQPNAQLVQTEDLGSTHPCIPGRVGERASLAES